MAESGKARRFVSLVRALVQKLNPYVPGEQPKVPGLIKLNTNENPYGPSPKVLNAVRGAVDERFRLYPSPMAEALRERLAEFHQCAPENILVGNGSDEILSLASRAFVDPLGRDTLKKGNGAMERSTIQYFVPSYSLYPVLAAIQGARVKTLPLSADFGLPPVSKMRASNRWDEGAALTFITTPNAPTGRGYLTTELEVICKAQRGVVLLDEAYADFAIENGLSLALRHPNVLVARTFSKAYSLCYLRVGYVVGHPDLIAAMDKIRDSYNVNGLAQVAAVAALGDLPYYRTNFKRIIATRDRFSRELGGLGFETVPSQTNFVLTRPPRFSARRWFELLRERKILVRWFDTPECRDYLRISIGTDEEINLVLRAIRSILKQGG